MILETIKQLGAWSWWVFGAVLLALELIAPGNVFVWFGLAAIVTGAVALLTTLGWQAELLIFVVLAAVFALAGRRFFARPAASGEQPLLNQRAARLIGNVYVLAEPIVDGHGRLKIDDTMWRVTGPDLVSGTRVRVTGADGAVLGVVPA